MQEIFSDMRTRFKAGWAILAITVLLALLVFGGIRAGHAAGNQPPGPDRYTVIDQKYTSYEWWLTSWVDNQVVCSIDVDHDGLPTAAEIYDACGQGIFDTWIVTQPCQPGDECLGYYLQLVKSAPSHRKVGVKQPAPTVWLTLNGCIPYQSTFRCEALPSIVLSGEEPLEGEHISDVEGDVDGKPFKCDPVCTIDLIPTDETGISLDFWANSSYGDSSELFTARVRVTKSTDPTDQAWYADVLSTQWRGDPLAGCSQIWDTFPPIGGTPDWLSTPRTPGDLATNVAYEYLAASLIKHQVVDTTACDAGGLLPNGLANTCGLEAARPMVNEWQNRFDSLIFAASQQTGAPAKLLKNIFARESQFWPGAIAGHPEAGLGQMTKGGADVVLMWNPSFYEQFCPTVLDQRICSSKIYPQPETNWQGMGLNDDERATLRNALVHSVDSVCPNCSMGIDLDKADFSVGVFAQTLIANCKQARKVIELNYGGAPGDAATYDDLWRFTLVNYNAGPGCLGLAVDGTSSKGEPLDWEHLSSHLTPACQGALDYINQVSGPG
jgi:hypothetical protein